MRTLKLYRTPAAPRVSLLPDDYVGDIGNVSRLQSVDDWVVPDIQRELRQLVRKLVVALHDLVSRGAIGGQVLDATIFVESLSARVRVLRRLFETDFRNRLASERQLNQRILRWSRQQGLLDFVDDLYESLRHS
jgi:hypothetical protein